DILLALLLVLLFSRQITKRLAILVRNAESLTISQQLATVKGNDEIAYLGTKIDQASQRLREATAHRDSIIDMVAHDVRAPLMAAQISLET
ncbi:hypothetical protein ABTJ52_20485, partial [Acinetobacter baumannii]